MPPTPTPPSTPFTRWSRWSATRWRGRSSTPCCSASFAAVAGLLAAIGIYGVLAYSVVQRTQEIGIRMALGAERGQVMALVMRRGVALAAIGITVGLIGAFAGARYLQSMLFGIEPRDPATFVAVAMVFAVVATAAAYLPARRATRVDPIVALRVD